MTHAAALKRLTICVIILLSITLSGVSFAIDGGATGWWTDADGNNHYGSAPSANSSQNSYNTTSTSSYSTSTPTYHNTAASNNWAYQQEQEEKLRRETESARRRQLQNQLQQEKEDIIRQMNEEKARQAEAKIEAAREWEKSKNEMLSALKDARGGLKLKGIKRTQEDYYKTLETEEVPSPSSTKKDAPKTASGVENISVPRQKPIETEGLGTRLWRKTVETKNKVKNWIHMKMLDESFNQTPIVRGFRSLQKKTQKWYKGMKELVVGIYDHAMQKFQGGVSELGSGKMHTDTEDDGTEAAGAKAQERAGKMAGDEIEGKGSF